MITTVAGTGRKGGGGDGGPALQGEFNMPHEIRYDKAGDLYVVDMGNHRVRKINMKTGIITSVAGPAPRILGRRRARDQGGTEKPDQHSVRYAR